MMPLPAVAARIWSRSPRSWPETRMALPAIGVMRTGWHRVAEAAGVGGVEHFHHLEVDACRARGRGRAARRRRTGRRRGRPAPLLDAGVGVVGAVAQRVRRGGRRRHPFEPVEIEVAQADTSAPRVSRSASTPTAAAWATTSEILVAGSNWAGPVRVSAATGGAGGSLVGGFGTVAHATASAIRDMNRVALKLTLVSVVNRSKAGVRGELRVGGAELAQPSARTDRCRGRRGLSTSCRAAVVASLPQLPLPVEQPKDSRLGRSAPRCGRSVRTGSRTFGSPFRRQRAVGLVFGDAPTLRTLRRGH